MISQALLDFNLKSSTREFPKHCCGHKKEVKLGGKYRKIKVNVNSRYDLTDHLQNNLFYQDCSLGFINRTNTVP